MTPGAARRRLPVLAEQLARAEGRRRALYAERLEVFKALVEDGDTQQEIADLANERVTGDDRITPYAVAFALHKDRKSGSRNGAEVAS